MAQDLDTIRGDFESRHRPIQMLNVQITPTIEDGIRVIYVSCHFGEKGLYFQQELPDPENRDKNRESDPESLSIKHNSNIPDV